MTPIFNRIASLLDRLQRRFHVARPGSVLILVVALLVLLALLGTAFIATTREDRYGAAQHAKNVQIDLLVDGVINMTQAAIDGDLRDAKGNYRPPDNGAGLPSGYDHYDGPGFTTPTDPATTNTMPDDLWMSSRSPRTQNIAAPFDAYQPYTLDVGGTVHAMWDAAGYPLIKNGATAGYPWQFDSPIPQNLSPSYPPAAPFNLSAPLLPLPGSALAAATNFTGKPWFEPVTVQLTVNGVLTDYPGFQAYAIAPGGNPAPYAAPFISADADGDGIADSGLWKLPVGRIDGVTYYAAVRIIDNNSAVNVNTAWTNREYNATPSPYAQVAPPKSPRYLFPSSIGLAELLRTYGASANAISQGPEMSALDIYRFRNLGPTQPVDDSSAAGAAHPEYAYSGLSEYLYTQLGARLGNPGHVTVGVGNTFQPLTISDSTALAYHGCFINPDASPSVLEGLFYNASPPPPGGIDSIYRMAPNAPSSATPRKVNYSASLQQADINAWYQQNHDVEGEAVNPPDATWTPRRDLLVARNPVSNQAPVHPLDTSAANTASTYALEAGIKPYSPAPATIVSPPRVSINQAPFYDLWRAYWNVMTEPSILPIAPANPTIYGSPFDLRVWYGAAIDPVHYRIPATPQVDPPSNNSPYIGRTFSDYIETAPLATYTPNPVNPTPYNPLQPVSNPQAYTDCNPARMFGSSIRAIPDPTLNTGDAQQWQKGYNNTTPRFNAQQQMLLRAAIAAVNAEDLRDSDADITAKRIILKAGKQNVLTPVDAVVYGTERQPFITEVYAETETDYAAAGQFANPYGYVAIELYNPYPQDIILKNWKLVAIDRRDTEAGGLGGGTPLPPYRNNAITHGLAPVTCNFTHNLPLDETTLIADFDPDVPHVGSVQDVFLPPTAPPYGPGSLPLVVPARGYLILENYDMSGAAPAGVAGHRPIATGLLSDGAANAALFNNGNDTSTAATNPPNKRATAGPGGTALPQVNVACIPGLSGMLDPAWNTPEWPVGAGTAHRSVFNRELVILRPRREDGEYSTGAYEAITTATTPPMIYPALPYDERPNLTGSTAGLAAGDVPYSHLRDLVPVDSFDFTGLCLPTGGAAPATEPLLKHSATGLTGNLSTAWHYSRQNIDVNGMIDWKFVYPGRYDAGPGVIATLGSPLLGDPRPRQQGTEYVSWLVKSAGDPSWNNGTLTTPITPITFGVNRTTAALESNANLVASYPTSFRIPLGVNNFLTNPVTFQVTGSAIGPSPLFTPGLQQTFPFGGFPRNGDMLAVPFIGAYRISYLTSPPNAAASSAGSTFTVAELNSVTMDASFAEDTDIYDDPITADDTSTGPAAAGTPEREQLGRFIPIRTLNSSTGTGIPAGVPDVSDYTAAGYPNPNYTVAAKGPVTVNDFGYDPSFALNPAGTATATGVNWEPFWRYHWAGKLFDYLATWSPAEDYQPNYPMQREFEPAILGTSLPSYYPGDHVSVYVPATVNGVATGQHVIYEYRGAPGFYNDVDVVPQPPFQIAMPGAGELVATAVKNGGDAAAYRNGNTGVYLPEEHTEDHVPIEGLININTASWRILATLPLVVNPGPPATGTPGIPDDTIVTAYGRSYRQLNEDLAKAIVYWRDIDANTDPAAGHPKRPHGPFRNLFELNRVIDLRPNALPLPGGSGYPVGTRPGFANALGTLPLPNTSGIDPDDALGDLAPAGTGADGVRSDYKERNLQLTRISNLITTRSDSFTCYVLVQGWRDAETANAKLVVQRRVGLFIDRSEYTPAHKSAITPQLFLNN
jgi:hypothetical protein